MFKVKIILLSIVVFIYYLSTFCILSRDTCIYYADYYIFASRSFSLKEEHKFDLLPIKQETQLFKTYYFNEDDLNINSIGFARYEKNGFWSNGNYVKISLKIKEPYSDIKIKFDVTPFVNKYNRSISVVIFLNNEPIKEWKFEYGRKKPETTIRIEHQKLSENSRVNLSFRINGYCSPFDLGLSQEHKKLGLSFNSMILLPYIPDR